MQECRKRDIRREADSFRKRCGVGHYGISNLFRDCESLGYKLLRYPLGESADLGFVLKRDNDTVIFTNSCSRLSRELFTLAHEIGHIVLHMDKDKQFVDDNMTLSGGHSDEKEQEANYFAACLLMPDDEVEKFLDLQLPGFNEKGLSAMDIARLMSEFNVSFDMALNRLENLGKIDSKERLRLDDERNERRVGNLLKSVVGNSRLNLPSMDIEIPHEYVDCVIYNYNHNAIPRETLGRALAYCQLVWEDVSDRLVEHADEDKDSESAIGDS